MNRDPRLTGVFILITFAMFWTFIGISGLPAATGVLLGLAAVSVLLWVLLLMLARRLHAKAPSRRRRQMSSGDVRGVGLVNLGQAIAIGIGVVVLIKIGAPALITPLMCLIVAAHFLPLARFYGQPQYWWTGGLMIAVAAAGAVLFSTDAAAPLIRIAIGFPAAVVLWCTALHVAKRG